MATNGLQEIEINGEIASYGVVLDIGIPDEPEDFFTPEELADQDPEGWRKYADKIDAAQINWLFRNPQYLDADTIAHLLKYPQKCTPEQLQWLKDHPGWDRNGLEDED